MRDYNTGQRRSLLSVLEKHRDEQFTAEQLVALIASDGGEISLSAVYRNIERLERDGMVRRSTADSGKKSQYQYIGTHCAGHLHLQCVSCGQITHLDDKTTGDMRRAVSSSSDFAIDERKTVLYGRCRECGKTE